MIEPFEENSTTELVLKALVRKLDLWTYLYDGFWATPDTALVMNKARHVAWGFEQDIRVGFTEGHNGTSIGGCNRFENLIGFANG